MHRSRSPPVILHDDVRVMGMRVMAGRGVGKSIFLGSVAFQDCIQGKTVVVFDDVGGTIDNILNSIVHQPEHVQRALWPKVRYIDTSGTRGGVTALPLYYRLSPDESLYRVAQRYLEVIKRFDPELTSASVQGFNALWSIGTYTGMLLSATGGQITEAEALLNDPTPWLAKAPASPELDAVIQFFTQEYRTWKQERRDTQTAAFRTKVQLVTLDPPTRAMVGASTPGIDWQEITEARQLVLIDLRFETSLELKRFKLLWVLMTFIWFLKHRGGGRHAPISLVIDELASLYTLSAFGSDVFSADLDELVNVLSRNHRVMLTVAHQEVWQLPERAQKTLMTLGTQVVGATSDIDAAVAMARQLFALDPYRLKYEHPIYDQGAIINHTPEFMSLDEQAYEIARFLVTQQRFHFVARIAGGEGSASGAIKRISTQHVSGGRFVNEALVAEVRRRLMQRDTPAIAPATVKGHSHEQGSHRLSSPVILADEL